MKNTHLCTHATTCKHRHMLTYRHMYKHAYNTHSKYIIDLSKDLRTVPIFFLGILYLRIIKFLHCWLPFPLYHQNRIQSTCMLNFFLFCWTEPSDSYFYMSITDHFPGSVRSTAIGKSHERKGCLFPVLPFDCLWSQNLHLIKLWHYPSPLQRGVLSSNLTQIPHEAVSLWLQMLETLVNLQSIVKGMHSPTHIRGACRMAFRNILQHLKTVGEEFWHQHVWHVALRTRSILTCILLDFLY